MAVVKFDGDGQNYLSWVAENPDGYVVNTGRSTNTKYSMIHRAGCSHITSMSGFKPGAYTDRNWIKVASHDINELQTWFTENYSQFPGEFKVCSSCKPMSKTKINRNFLFPEVLEGDITTYTEGVKMQITVNAYERNPQARLACLRYHGYSCKACGINFGEVYGDIGKDFIHVHHIVELNNPSRSQNTNPITDLVPVCPNCHAMLHRETPCLTVEDLRLRIRRPHQ
jgi:5-methylcytosine-specific restriction protein A